ncbi:hypothetical protein [Dysgonomonas termitidis]|uniref:Uncharacterized protein n=1 Tax=Dysgonomonas termitidis TaxID=1516126 RepID=A0ABV9KTG6_9BACT
MHAKEARKLTEENIRPFEVIIQDIEQSASRGNQMICIPVVTPEYQMKLVELGYKISKHTDPIGLDLTKIEW